MKMRHTIRAAAIIALAGGLAACGVIAPGERPGGERSVGDTADTRYVIYFDLGGAAVTDEGKAVLNILGKEIGNAKSVSIKIAGHTDRVGSAADNLKLAERRVASVVAILTEMGVKEEVIETVALGETNPAVPTPDGVPKGQNRRVEIFVTKHR